uniref:Uncharacterized protein n=1 Tax=Romanomermis culicivorax TaxID=13658 RepID=A0A915J9T4_ROMCU
MRSDVRQNFEGSGLGGDAGELDKMGATSLPVEGKEYPEGQAALKNKGHYSTHKENQFKKSLQAKRISCQDYIVVGCTLGIDQLAAVNYD